MPELKSTIATALTARYKNFAGTVFELAAPLNEEQFWGKPFPFGNSFGHLVLHVTGNLNYYIGTQIAATGYVRDRPLEFTDATRPAKADVLRNFEQAIEMVLTTINCQSAEDWSRDYTAAGSDARDRFDNILDCATHLRYHIGQMRYLGFELKRKG